MPNISEMFAPAYQRDDPTKMAALQTWTDKNQGLTTADVEATRMPNGVNVGDPRGMVDPAALQALAQGGPYDKEARRNAIAAQVQANQAAAAPAAPAAGGGNQFGGTPYGLPSQGFMPLPGQNWYGGPMASS